MEFLFAEFAGNGSAKASVDSFNTPLLRPFVKNGRKFVFATF